MRKQWKRPELLRIQNHKPGLIPIPHKMTFPGDKT